MIEFLFLDLDDTILDFHMAERVAVTKTFAAFGIEPTEQLLHRYHLINKACWEKLERKEWTRAQVLVNRFQMVFDEVQVESDPVLFAQRYAENLAIGHYFLPGAEEAVMSLHKKYRMFLASNGTASVQAGRLTSANLYRFFETVFVSEELGANKPAPEFFERAFSQIPGFQKEKAIMVGDSLTSDILGGIRAGIKTCWVNPNHMPGNPDIQPDYEIESITQLEALLETL